MKYRRLGKTGFPVSEIGFGAWGIGGAMWGDVDDSKSIEALNRSIELGLNFIDTAWGYGDGHSEKIVGQVIRGSGKEIYVATKIPPKNRQWPAPDSATILDAFPKDYIREYVEKSLENLGLPHIDVMQFHVWNDKWANQSEWQEAVQELTKEGLVKHWGISINDFQPENSLQTLETKLISVVQVIFNIFEQKPSGALFSACERLDVGVIARVPLDEGALTGTITPSTVLPENDWRTRYFRDERKQALADKLAPLEQTLSQLELKTGSLAEAALRFCLSDSRVSTVIPGMRGTARVEQNVAFSDGNIFTAADLDKLEAHAWEKNWYQ